MTKLAETSSGPFFSRSSIFGLISLQVLAVVFVVGHEERRAHVAFERRALPASSRKRVVEAAEVRQVGHVLHQRLHPRREGRALGLAALGEALLDLAARSRPAP